MKRVYTLMVLSLLILAITGCETVKGMGRDIATVGHWITRGSSKTQAAP